MNKFKFFFTSIVPFFIESSIFLKICIITCLILLIIILINFFSFYFARERNEIGISIKYEKYTPEKHQILLPSLFDMDKLAEIDKKGLLIIEVKNNTNHKMLEDIKLRIKSKFLIYDVTQLYDEEDKSNQLINYGKFKKTEGGMIGIVTSGADLKIDSLRPPPENKVLFYILVEKIVGTQKDALDKAISFEGWYKSSVDGKSNDKKFQRLVNVSGL